MNLFSLMFVGVQTTLGRQQSFNEPKGVHSLCMRPNVVYTLINPRKMKLIRDSKASIFINVNMTELQIRWEIEDNSEIYFIICSDPSL